MRSARRAIAIAIFTHVLRCAKKGREKSFDFPRGVDPEFLIVTFIPLTIREAWRTSINYSERWKILLRPYTGMRILYRRRHGVLFYGPRRIVSPRFAHFDWRLTKEAADQSMELRQRTWPENPRLGVVNHNGTTALCYSQEHWLPPGSPLLCGWSRASLSIYNSTVKFADNL